MASYNPVLAAFCALGLAGSAQAATVISQDFESAGTGAYSTVDGQVFGAGVDATSFPDGNVLYMRGINQGRQIQFSPVDLSTGGTIKFDFIIGDYNLTNQVYFEGQDGGIRGSYDEDVTFSYSTDGGTTWSDFDTYSSAFIGSGTRSIGGWTTLNYALAASPTLASTTLRFLQPNNSGETYDHWAIDNITVDNNAGVAAVPEPASWAMLIGGFGMVGGSMRARRRNVATLAATA